MFIFPFVGLFQPELLGFYRCGTWLSTRLYTAAFLVNYSPCEEEEFTRNTFQADGLSAIADLCIGKAKQSVGMKEIS